MSPRAWRLVRWGAAVALVALLVAFARTVDWRATWLAMRGAAPGVLLLAAVANLVSITFKGVRWWLLIRPIGDAPLGMVLRATMAGAGLNDFLMGNSGEAARVFLVARSAGLPISRVLATLAIDRAFDAIGFVVLLVAATFALSLPEPLARWRLPGILCIVVAIGLAIFLVRRTVPAEDVEPGPALRGVGRLSRAGSRFVRALSVVSSGPRFAAALGFTGLVWALQLASYGLTARATGLPLPLAGMVTTLLAVNLSFAIRVTPGNVGTFQLVYALAAESFGIDREAAIATGLLIQAQQNIPTSLLALVLAPGLLFRRKTARRLVLEATEVGGK